jgi:hypothetical protein
VSQPTLGAALPKIVVEDGIARVTDTGDFFLVGDQTPVTHRCLLVQKIGGPTVYGTDPGKSTPADRLPPGAMHRDQLVLQRIALAPGDYRWWMWGGVHSRYVRADGSVAYDVYEWGNYDLSHPERVAEGTLTVASTKAPAPTPVSERPWMPYVERAREASDIAVAVMEQEGVSFDVRRKQRAGMAAFIYHADDATRRRAYTSLAKEFGWPL